MFESAQKHEKEDNYKITERYGFFRPSSSDRKEIQKSFANIDIQIFGRGYDLIDLTTKNAIANKSLSSIIKDICLYELKSTWRKDVGSDFSGFGFGITENEIRNFLSLGNNFKIVFLNGITENIAIRYFRNIQNHYTHAAYFFTLGNKRGKTILFEDVELI